MGGNPVTFSRAICILSLFPVNQRMKACPVVGIFALNLRGLEELGEALFQCSNILYTLMLPGPAEAGECQASTAATSLHHTSSHQWSSDPLLGEWRADNRCETEVESQSHLLKAIFLGWSQPAWVYSPLTLQSFSFLHIFTQFPGATW